MIGMIPLPRLAARLYARTGVPQSYRKLYMMAVDGKLPCELINGRLFVRDDQLPAIEASLGLIASTPAN